MIILATNFVFMGGEAGGHYLLNQGGAEHQLLCRNNCKKEKD